MKENKSINRIQAQMEGLSPESLRYRVLDASKRFKSSWIELGQYLYAVNKDKLYKDWGHTTFEFYCAKEIGIKEQTAVKLLKSYYFLEKEEPSYLKERASAPENRRPTEVPSLESVNALRLAHQSERISESDYEKIRTDVLEKGSEPEDVRKKIKYYLKPTAEKELSEAERKNLAAKKMHAYVETALGEFSALSFPNKLLKKMEELLDLLADYK